MAITLVNTTSAVQNTSATTITVNVPSGVSNGDVLILVLTSGSFSNSWTTPSGWTTWSTATSGRRVYYRIAASEPASYTITQSGSTTADGYMLAYNGAAIDVIGSYGSVANPSVAPAITTSANDAYVFDFASSTGSGTASITYTTPSGYTALVSDSDATIPSSAIFYKIQTTAGTTGTASTTPSVSTATSILFSIIPTAVINGDFFFMMGM